MATTVLKNYVTKGIGTSPIIVYNPSGVNVQGRVIGLTLANLDVANIHATVILNTDDGGNTYLVRNVLIPSNNALNVVGSAALVVEQNDYIQVSSSTSNSIDVIVSTEEVYP